ncbi:MAG: hypothetical protein QME79_10340 [Bacillota bacterium]|nr:hypothetical protein [Bacillota bacterium]
MKKAIFGAILLACLLSVSTVALAALPGQVTVYVPSENGWAALSKEDPASLARAFTSIPALNRSCDKATWTETFTNHASVTQWLNYSFAGTRWDWQVRKPGIFAADCISFTIQSNDDVVVTFADFADLEPQVHEGAAPIPVAYSFGDTVEDATANGWVPAAELNEKEITLPYEVVAGGVNYKLWNKIVVDQTTRACDYEDSGTITIALTDVKPFVDPADGEYWDLIY